MYVEQAKIPGRFTGRAKKTMMVIPGIFILVAKTGVVGSLALEMVAMVSREDLSKIEELTFIHPNITSLVTDQTDLTTRTTANEGGFEFEGREEEINIDDV